MADLDLGNLLAHLRLDGSQFVKQLNTAEARLKSTAKKMEQVGRTLTLRVTAPILGIGVASVKAFSSFDDAMTKSTAIMSDATKSMRAEMEKTAISISKNSVTSATELARSYFFLASAGLSAEQSVAALATVERFAVAGAFDMALATDLVTDAQSALGLTVENATQNMINMTRVSDVLTGANTLANASTLQFSKSLTSQAGPAMKAFNVELEEGVAVLAAYADQGIKAEEAGNMFSRMLRLMTKGFQSNRAAWKNLGIDIFDANRNLRPMADIVRDLTGLLGPMSTEMKVATLTTLGFQARSQQAILPLIGMGDAIAYYRKELDRAQGITEEIANKQLKSFASQMKILWNNVVAAARIIGEKLAPALIKANEKIKEGLAWWEGLNDSTQNFIIELALMTAAVGPALLVVGKLLQGIILLKVAMFAAAGAATALSIALIGIGVAVASWRLSAWARENIKPFAIWMEKLAQTIMASWILIKFAFKDGVLKIRQTWSKGIALLKLEWASFLISVQESLGWWENVLGKDLGFEELGDHIHKLNMSATKDFQDLTKEIEENTKEYDRQMAFLVETTDQAIQDIEDKFAGADIKPITVPTGSGSNYLPAKFVPQATQEEDDLTRQLTTQEKMANRVTTSMQSLNSWLETTTDTWNRVSDVAVNALNSTADAITDFMMTGKADFKALAVSILADLARMIVRMMLAKMIMSALGIGGAPTDTGGGGTQNIYPAHAAGALYGMGKIIPFASGGVAMGPTFLPTANGNTALIGEKKPEAIMPLTRTNGGELGVKAAQPNINVEPKVTVNNIFDKTEIVGAMDSPEGDTVILNTMKRHDLL